MIGWIRDNGRALIAVAAWVGFAWFVWPPAVLAVIGAAALTAEIVDYRSTR